MKKDQASSTAYTVLQGLLSTASKAKYGALVGKESAEVGRHILSSTEEGKKRLGQLEKGFSRFLLLQMEKIMLPGITLHYALRKRFIENHALQAIEQGVTQIVNLGAGFDTLAWRLHKRYPHVQCIEIDYPATSNEKSQTLTASETAANNLHLLAVDLAEHDLSEVLKSNNCFDPTKKTLYICEGVLMYLDLSAVSILLESLRNFTPETQFIFTATAPMSSVNNNATWLLRLYLHLKKEPLIWSIEQQEIPSFLEQHGYTMTDVADDIEMHQRYIPEQESRKLHRGEFAVASAAIPNSQK